MARGNGGRGKGGRNGGDQDNDATGTSSGTRKIGDNNEAIVYCYATANTTECPIHVEARRNRGTTVIVQHCERIRKYGERSKCLYERQPTSVSWRLRSGSSRKMVARGRESICCYALQGRKESNLCHLHVGWSNRGLVKEQTEIVRGGRASDKLGGVQR